MCQQSFCLRHAVGAVIHSQKIISPQQVLLNPAITLKPFLLPGSTTWDQNNFVVNGYPVMPGISMPGIFYSLTCKI
jgi:hypothetical protein